MSISPSVLESITNVLVNVTVLAAAVVAVVKFRLFNLFSHRFRAEVACAHSQLPGGRILFRGDYIVHNTGERPIALRTVDLRLLRARELDGGVIEPDEATVLAARVIASDRESVKGLHRIEAGERSIFTLRCILDQLDDVVFFVCRIGWPHRRDPAPYIGLYVTSDDRDELRREVSQLQ